jgi:hypothetical protein
LLLQGAERKTRDEERRAAKRKMTATGRKKMDELYHPATERSEFYSMSDLTKPPVLFTPAEDIDKVSRACLIYQHRIYQFHLIFIPLDIKCKIAISDTSFYVCIIIALKMQSQKLAKGICNCKTAT